MSGREHIDDGSSLATSVKAFIGFFREKLEHIAAVDIEGSGRLFQKTLYVGVLDALAGSVSFPKKGNRERMVSLIRHFSGWAHCDNISLPHLRRLLQKVPDHEFSRVRQHTLALYDKWSPPGKAPSGAILELDKDPSFEEIQKFWPKNLPEPLERVSLQSLQHANLFYAYRNSLMHELREPGYGMDSRDSNEPYYHTMSESDSEEYTWELVYPLGFYRTICETTLSQLEDYYLKEQIDPYSQYKFGSYWIEVLNP